MLKDTTDTIVIIFAFIVGAVLTVMDNPLTGEFALLGVIAVWELGKYLSRTWHIRHTHHQN